jgi:iron-sulfur cluster repair protein YtfE (RIC family)
MDPFELLKKDHETVSELFKRIEAAHGKAKRGLFDQLRSELDVHTFIEETIFYPALKNERETRDLTLEAYEEHKVVKDLLAELEGVTKPSDEWDAKLKVLKENVEHHVDEEENELFDKANDVLTSEEAERLGDRMQAEKVKRGASTPVVAPKEEPGLLQTIANALGLGESTESGKKQAGQKPANTSRPGKQAGAQKVSNKTSAKPGAAESKSAKATTAKTSAKKVGTKSYKSSAAKKATTAKRKGVSKASAPQKTVAKSAAKKSAAKKKGAGKKRAGKKSARRR